MFELGPEVEVTKLILEEGNDTFEHVLSGLNECSIDKWCVGVRKQRDPMPRSTKTGRFARRATKLKWETPDCTQTWA